MSLLSCYILILRHLREQHNKSVCLCSFWGPLGGHLIPNGDAVPSYPERPLAAKKDTISAGKQHRAFYHFSHDAPYWPHVNWKQKRDGDKQEHRTEQWVKTLAPRASEQSSDLPLAGWEELSPVCVGVLKSKNEQNVRAPSAAELNWQCYPKLPSIHAIIWFCSYNSLIPSVCDLKDLICIHALEYRWFAL